MGRANLIPERLAWRSNWDASQKREQVETLRRLNVLMAESRLLELEITEGNSAPNSRRSKEAE